MRLGVLYKKIAHVLYFRSSFIEFLLPTFIMNFVSYLYFFVDSVFIVFFVLFLLPAIAHNSPFLESIFLN